IQLIADLELPKEGVIWDICAGVGSIGLEAIRVRPKLQLVAIEKRLGAYKLIEENAKRLLVKPHAILEAEALEALTRLNIQKELCSPDRVILGGGGSQRKELLEVILRRLNPKGIVVIPLATIEAISELTNILKEAGCAASISQHQTSRGVSLNLGTRLAPMNPVFIVKGKLK
ncbi:MAG: precorrin-6Y C5,15-methyltransferase (decarboxylating) subunit CbiT, partial [Prochlorococcaceae cyanobacterium ETNP1_MAG_9]|nr:precorrin-6Y C5,15-methyltransferase (decarboxylating) subunit CbiT [Prochlorococcaceae cyanobacterium ETNP1_MAG_9]